MATSDTGSLTAGAPPHAALSAAKGLFHVLRASPSAASVVDYLRFISGRLPATAVLATLPRSGFNYLALALALACEYHLRGSADYRYENEVWVTRYQLFVPCDYRAAWMFRQRATPGLPMFFHTHSPVEYLPSQAIRGLRKIVLVRDPLAQLKSRIVHAGYGERGTEEFMRAGLVQMTVDFMNSWGDLAARDPGVSLLRYEDLIADPLSALRDVCAHVQLMLPDPALAAALALASKDESAKRIPSAEANRNPRVSLSQHQSFSPDVREQVLATLRAGLRHDFGYSLA